MTQSEHHNNDNDDNMMFNFGGLLQCQNSWYMQGKCDNKKGDLN